MFGPIVKVALVITTFNRPTALHRVLKTVAMQTRLPDEVVVCDDGPNILTAAAIVHWATRLNIAHVWQTNSNFRAARVRNLGALKSNADYLIWIDGDCLVPPHFVKRHLELAEHGYLVSGGRHLLTDTETNAYITGAIPCARAFRHSKFHYLPVKSLRNLRPVSWKPVRTCNLGLYRDDLVAVGGFDETYIGWGREDSDIVIRLLNSGVRIRSGRLATCVAHLHHVEGPRGQGSPNERRFQNLLMKSSHVVAQKGVFEQ